MRWILALCALLLAACAATPGPTGTPASSPTPLPSPSATPAPPGPLVSVELRGGHCMDGAACGTTVVLHTDGTVHGATKPPNELGTVPRTDVDGLTDLIARTDFDAIKAVPFNGTCPVAFDGQEAVYEFTTARGVVRIESCTTQVDPKAPIFAAVAGVLADFVQLPEYAIVE